MYIYSVNKNPRWRKTKMKDKNFKNVIEKFEKKKGYKLRQWQQEALSKISEVEPGKVVLCDATCGAGKSTVQALHIASEMARLEEQGKHGIFMIASPRLMLNGQLYGGLEEKIENFHERVRVYNLSSGDLVDENGNTIIKMSDVKLDGMGRGSLANTLKKKHVLIVGCFKTLNNNVEEGEPIEALEKLLNARTKTAEDVFDVVVIDEVHKGFKKNTFKTLNKMSRFLTLYSATPTKTNKTNADEEINYGFSRALEDGVVVKPVLYTVTADELTDENKMDIKCSRINSVFKHLHGKYSAGDRLGKRPVLCVFDNGVDNLNVYRDSLKKIYGDEIDVAVYASAKTVRVKDSKGVTQSTYELKMNFNGVEVDSKEELRRLQEDSNKPLVILSAYMLQEGIDMPYINGVLVLGEKTDTNLYQAVCRGDRLAEDKDHFNVYVPDYLIGDIDDFLGKLVDGFENKMDFGDGEERATGQSNAVDDEDLSKYPNVVPFMKRHHDLCVKLINDYDEEHKIEISKKRFFDRAKELLDNGGTVGEALALTHEMGHELFMDEDFVDSFYDFCEVYGH